MWKGSIRRKVKLSFNLRVPGNTREIYFREKTVEEKEASWLNMFWQMN